MFNNFTFRGKYRIKIHKIYDGDTVTAAMKFRSNHYELFKIRIQGIDTPEIKYRGLTKQMIKNNFELIKTNESLLKKYICQCKGKKARTFLIRTLYDNCKQSTKKTNNINEQQMLDLLQNYKFTLDCIGQDKYGRLLGDIYLPIININLSEHMIISDHALPYDGKKKTDFIDLISNEEIKIFLNNNNNEE